MLAEVSSDGGFLKSIGFSDFDRSVLVEADDELLATGDALLDDDDVDGLADADAEDFPLDLDFDEEDDFFGDLDNGITIPKASAKLVPIVLSISSISSSESSTTASSLGFLATDDVGVACSFNVFFAEECFVDDSCFRLSE